MRTITYLQRRYSINNRPINKLSDWAYHVKYRDNFTCQDCGSKPKHKRFVQAHHIKPKSLFPKLKFDVRNGITLCHWCHKKREGRVKKKKYFNQFSKEYDWICTLQREGYFDNYIIEAYRYGDVSN